MSHPYHSRGTRTVRELHKDLKKLGRIEQLEDRCLLNARRVWTIGGDKDPQDLSDHVIIDRDPVRPANLRAIVNGELVATRVERKLGGIRINSGDGDDTVFVDESLGAILVRARAHVDGRAHPYRGGAGGPVLDPVSRTGPHDILHADGDHATPGDRPMGVGATPYVLRHARDGHVVRHAPGGLGVSHRRLPLAPCLRDRFPRRSLVRAS